MLQAFKGILGSPELSMRGLGSPWVLVAVAGVAVVAIGMGPMAAHVK